MNQHITREQAAELIGDLREHHNRLVDALNLLSRATGHEVSDGPIGNAVWRFFDTYVNLIDTLCGGFQSQPFSWFVFENQWGAKGFEHSLPCGTMRAIRSIDDILDVMGYSATGCWADEPYEICAEQIREPLAPLDGY